MLDGSASIANLARQLDALGIEQPAKATAIIEANRAAQEAANATPADDLAGAIIAGTIDDVAAAVRDAARAYAEREYARRVVQDMNTPLTKAQVRAYRDDADRIIEDLRPSFDAAAEAVTEAAQLGITPDLPTDKALSKGAQAASALADLKGHAATLDAIHHARQGLTSTGYGRNLPRVASYVTRLDEATRNAFEDSRGHGRQWLRLVLAGAELHLNTAAEARAVIDDEARRAEQAAEAKRNRRTAKEQRADERLAAAWNNYSTGTRR